MTEAAGWDDRITENEVRQALKTVKMDKSLGIDGRPYEVYLLNTDLNILAKILADRLQTALPIFISYKEPCALKGKTIQDRFHIFITC